MKTNPGFLTSLCFMLIFGCASKSPAQDKVAGAGAAENSAVSVEALRAVQAPGDTPKDSVQPGSPRDSADRVPDFAGKTDMDDPGLHDPRFVPATKGRDHRRKLSKIDLDSDLDYDGTFDNSSPSGQLQREFIPPGLEVGVGELTRLLLRFKTYEELAAGALVVVLEVSPIDREISQGTAVDDAATGRIRIWRDQDRKELLLDSMDPEKRRFEWTFDPAKISGGIPRTVYLEGVAVSPKHEGDLRLLVHSGPPEVLDAPADEGTAQPAFDHLLVTVRKEPVDKEFINNNAEAVWSMIESR